VVLEGDVIKLADLFPGILVSLCAAFVFAPLLTRLALRVGLVDMPGSQPHKWHSAPTPMAGGTILALALLVSYLTVLPAPDPGVRGILLAGAVVYLWGLWDDRFALPAWAKLLGQILAALILWFAGIRVHLLGSDWLDFGITVFWIVGMVNAFNFVDSMDGLALGLAAIGAAFFMLVTVDSQQPALAALSAAIVGATIGAFFYNASPARMFIGDSGSQLLGLLLAAVGMAYAPIGLNNLVSWFTPILVLGIPVFNMVLVVSSRLWRGLRVYQAHKDHVSHRLVHLGLDKTRTVLVIQLTAIVLGLTAFIALGGTPLTANLLFGLVVLTGIVVIIFLERRYPREESEAEQAGGGG
jgi:UDP-GlcNAc:undecaprenyl-phosphate GlcNAc-1-phosphate transferase